MNSVIASWHRIAVTAFPAGMLLVALSILSGGCATSAQTRSGFISDYGRIGPVPGLPGMFAEKKASYDPSRTVHVEPVSWAAGGADCPAVPDDDRVRLCLFARDEIERAIARLQPAVAPGVSGANPLEFVSAITRVQEADPALNVVTTLALFVPMSTGGVCLEWKLLDTSSGETVARGVAVQTGKPWQPKACFEPLGHAMKGIGTISDELASYLHGAPDGMPPSR